MIFEFCPLLESETKIDLTLVLGIFIRNYLVRQNLLTISGVECQIAYSYEKHTVDSVLFVGTGEPRIHMFNE